MIHTDHAPLTLQQDQRIAYVSPTGSRVEGIVWNPKPIYGIMHEARYEVRVYRKGKPGPVKIIPASWIRKGQR